MDKILKVTGKGTIRLRPDTTCAEITLQGTEKEYAAALAKAQKELEEVKGALAGAGFPEEEIKTSDFRTETKYEGVPRRERGLEAKIYRVSIYACAENSLRGGQCPAGRVYFRAGGVWGRARVLLRLHRKKRLTGKGMAFKRGREGLRKKSRGFGAGGGRRA